MVTQLTGRVRVVVGVFVSLPVVLAVGLVACSSSSGPRDQNWGSSIGRTTGGTTDMGGTTGMGGSAGMGGSTGVGGSAGMGGSAGVGGSAGMGGSAGVGGSTGVGGSMVDARIAE
jgi:hypothetical protein